VLAAGELHPRTGHQRHRRAVRRHDHLIGRRGGAVSLALAAAASLWGCGGGEREATTAELAAGKGQVLVAALGDSITAGSPLWDPDPATRAGIGVEPSPKSQYEYWASRADSRLVFRNCGVLGERTDEIAARLRDCAEGADALIVQGGINDIAQALGSGASARKKAVAAAARNLAAMVKAGKRMGLDVFLANVLPWTNGFPHAVAPINGLNGAIARIGHAQSVPVLDFYSTLEDPKQAGIMRSDWTADGDHPSIAGYALLGERAVVPALEHLSGNSH
jgi:lysophospholipase L1-like esterase